MTERERLEALVAQQEAAVRRAFAAFLENATSPAVLREAREALARGNIDAALEIVDQHVVRFANIIPQVLTETASSELDALGSRFKNKIGGATVAIGFDATDNRATELARTSRLDFIRDFTREQRLATRTALSEVLSEGGGPRQAAARFKDSIGLTRAQLQIVDNYRNLLETQNAAALDRVLRDRRFDPTVQRSLEEGADPLPAATVDRMVARYRDRLLASRAETIARTESHRMLSQAREEAVQQMIEQSGIDPESVRRVWHATQDARTRDSHFAMDGQERRLHEPFRTPSGIAIQYPGDPNAPASEVINCRCVLTLRFLSDAEREAA